MKTKTYNVYTYDELSKDAQENALQNFRDINEMPFLSQYMNETVEELIKKNNIEINSEKVELLYSLSHCQGDGVMFAGHFEWKDYTIQIQQSGYYTHKYSKTIDMQDWNEDGVDFIDVPKREEDEFERIYIDICDELEKKGYTYIDNENSEEFIKELFEANEYEFTCDGKID